MWFSPFLVAFAVVIFFTCSKASPRFWNVAYLVLGLALVSVGFYKVLHQQYESYAELDGAGFQTTPLYSLGSS